MIPDIKSILPRHKCELIITHNPHASYYQNAAEYLNERDFDACEFATPDSRAAIVASNELWECQWYPDTPIGFNSRVAESWEALAASLVDWNRKYGKAPPRLRLIRGKYGARPKHRPTPRPRNDGNPDEMSRG